MCRCLGTTTATAPRMWRYIVRRPGSGSCETSSPFNGAGRVTCPSSSPSTRVVQRRRTRRRPFLVERAAQFCRRRRHRPENPHERVLAHHASCARLLRRAPGFTTVSVLTLGLGIGACAAIFTVVYSVLLAPLPYDDPDRLVQVWQVNPKGGRSQFSDPNFADLRDQARSFAALAQYSQARSPVAGLRVPLRARVAIVSRDMPRALRLRPMLGRWFVSEEQRVGGRAAMVVSHAFWRQFLDGTRDLSRRTVTYDGEPYAVVGVLAPDARFPGTDVDLWVPRERWAPLPSRTAHNWRVIGRLADGVPLAQARAEAHAIASRLKQQYGEDTWMTDARLVPLRDEIVGSSRVALLVLLAGAGFLLLVACANVVNLLLTRAVARRREVAIRAALGGARARLVVPFVVEAMLLADRRQRARDADGRREREPLAGHGSAGPGTAGRGSGQLARARVRHGDRVRQRDCDGAAGGLAHHPRGGPGRSAGGRQIGRRRRRRHRRAWRAGRHADRHLARAARRCRPPRAHRAAAARRGSGLPDRARRHDGAHEPARRGRDGARPPGAVPRCRDRAHPLDARRAGGRRRQRAAARQRRRRRHLHHPLAGEPARDRRDHRALRRAPRPLRSRGLRAARPL